MFVSTAEDTFDEIASASVADIINASSEEIAGSASMSQSSMDSADTRQQADASTR